MTKFALGRQRVRVLDGIIFKSEAQELNLRKLKNCFLSDNTSIDMNPILSYDVAPGSEITPCNKIYKPLVVYRFLPASL